MVIEIVERAAYTEARCRCRTVTVVIGGAKQITAADTRAGLDELIAHARHCPAALGEHEHQDDEPAPPAEGKLGQLLAERYPKYP